MQVVINIPDKVYEMVMNTGTYGCYRFNSTKAIRNGVPLPKGHGKLIDADALEKLCYKHEIGNSIFDGEPIIEQGRCNDGDNIWKPLFDFAPTIIEADKEESEEI